MVPGYPALPVTAFISSALLALVLLTSAVRRSWNMGVTALCLCELVVNLTGGIETIVWRDNADIKLYVFCDLVSRYQVFASIVRPASVLVITRNLYNISCMQGFVQTDGQRRFERWFNLTMLLFIPALVAGPLYYVVQTNRFVVIEGYGCTNITVSSILTILIMYTWPVFIPLYSIVAYCPRIFWTFFKHNQAMNRFLATNGAGVSRSRFLRVLAIASLDVVLTLPPGVIAFSSSTVRTLAYSKAEGISPWYSGWEHVHEDWAPVSWPLELLASDKIEAFSINYSAWFSAIIPFAVFSLFGLTKTARAAYWHALCSIARVFGWDLALTVKKREQRDTLLPMSFGKRTHRTQASGLGTQFSVLVDVASAVRRDARDEIDAEHHAPRTANAHNEEDTSTFERDLTTPKPLRESVLLTPVYSVESLPMYLTNPVDIPPPVYLTNPR